MTRRAAPERPHAAVVYQPFKTDLPALRTAVAEASERAGWAKTKWYEIEEHDAGVGATKRAVAEGARVVLGSGGDGTIRAISEALAHTGVPLAIVPQGTGNLLARNVGVLLGDFRRRPRPRSPGSRGPSISVR